MPETPEILIEMVHKYNHTFLMMYRKYNTKSQEYEERCEIPFALIKDCFVEIFADGIVDKQFILDRLKWEKN